MEEPIEPSKEDCCNSGCNPCIFDVYERQLKKYMKYIEGQAEPEDRINAISQLDYTQFQVVYIEELCENHKLIMFKLHKITKKYQVWWNPGDHFLIKYNSKDVVCSRPYTPIKLRKQNNKINEMDFAIIVKRYNDGLVSRYLYDLSIGSQTLWRGPYGSYSTSPNSFDRIIMIAQGTGITAFTSIIESIVTNEDDMTKIVLLYCCKNLDTVLLREEIYYYKSFWNFNYKIYTKNNNHNLLVKYNEPIIFHKLDYSDFSSIGNMSTKDQILLCGNEQFMQYYKVFFEKVLPLENIVLFG